MTDAFFRLHEDLPREGPGDRASLDWALKLAGVAREARVLDAGCGPGADIAGLLAHVPEGHVTALDAHAGFVAQARARLRHEPRLTVREGDMARPGGPYDLIWSAGALYFLGITDGLKTWRAALAPGGAVAFSELVFLVDTPAPELRETLEAEYPRIGGPITLEERIEAAGYEVLGVRILPDEAWEAYYGPLEARCDALEADADPALQEVIDAARAEIDLWRTHRNQFGYALAVARPA
ncbi:methyltransferase domain-containing protein [Maritimibacter sp. DP07]|uniref:Methyltransferase domain-containing protein n=1 Tax=Maritimibacter harenae TaxID=2606218 RepID=A0A845M8D9_9RHOB|nr:class I SAM-dependent methyltransferase [Maritimibacter harenae]MZR12934.1 methyltransferase domain-containing protein [Maritimibacter harenae]